MTLNPKAFITILKVFSIFILSSHEKKKKMTLKNEQSSQFFVFKGSYLEYIDTFRFYDYLANQDLKFLLENLNLIFKFKALNPGWLNTVLNSLQVPTTRKKNDSKRNNSTN